MTAIRRFLLGESPRSLLVLLSPTLLALVVDAALRGRTLAGYATQGKLIYLSSLLLSAAFWFLPLFLAARVARAAASATGPRRALARAGLALFFGLWIFPLATFCFPGQVLYRSVFDVYMGRDTLRLGIAFQSTVRDWFASAGPLVVAEVAAAGMLVTAGIAAAVKRAAAASASTTPALSVVTFAASAVLFWYDQVDSRFLQAATPDACFVHGLVRAAKVAIRGRWGVRQGLSLRHPAPLPPLVSERAHPPSVLLVLTESVRADTLCSDPPPACRSEALDPVTADRIPLGKLTAPAPNTFSTCVLLWTGLDVTMDFTTAHAAPVLWELARAVGYRTAYVTSQNPSFEDFGLFVRRAGIDVLQTATDLGGMEQEQIGAPDERATAAALRFVRETEGPYFAVLHLANTHMPYRVDPDLQPYAPHAGTPVGNARAFHNHYRNSVLRQERILASFFRELRSMPGWGSTVVIFLSDHGEQFREHGSIYHNHSFFDEDLRVPGFVLAGAQALDETQRAALATYRGRRTYTQDVHATVVDLLGLHGARGALPFADKIVGRSLLRPADGEPAMLLATSTAVWEPTDALYGVMLGERLLVGTSSATTRCFDIAADPGETNPLPADRCGEMVEIARRGHAALR